MNCDVECLCNTVCEFLTALDWVNNKIKNAADKFLNIVLSVLENINNCIVINYGITAL